MSESVTPMRTTSSSLPLSWDSSTDPDNPKNWTMWRRQTTGVIIATISLLSSFASSAAVPAAPAIMNEFGVADRIIGILTTSVYVLGLGIGPFVLSPLSELYGRRIIYTSTLWVFTALQVGCALSNSVTLLIVFRFLSGVTGSVAPSLGQASMADVWEAHERGRWTAILSLGPLSGPPLGSIVAALILSQKSWRWIFWMLTILSFFMCILLTFIVKETYAPVILRRRQIRRVALEMIRLKREQPNNPSPAIQTVEQISAAQRSALFKRAITRPVRFLLTSPILILVSTFLAYVYGMLYLLLVSLPILFGRANAAGTLLNYGFTILQTGLAYLGLWIGFIIGCITQVNAQSRIWNALTSKTGVEKPEYRLLTMSVGMTLFPISLLWYGWSAQGNVPWIMPEIGTLLFAIGMFMTFQSIQVYVTEAFIPYSASANAAATLLRCMTGAVFPLFGEKLFQRLGYGWAGTLLALLAVPAIPVPYILYRYGPYLRKRFEFMP